jgi:hypothetical protein
MSERLARGYREADLPMKHPDNGITRKLRALKSVAEWTEANVESEADKREWREVQAVLDECIAALNLPGSVR